MSNALLKSKNTAQMSSPESSSLCQLSVVAVDIYLSYSPILFSSNLIFLL